MMDWYRHLTIKHQIFAQLAGGVLLAILLSAWALQASDLRQQNFSDFREYSFLAQRAGALSQLDNNTEDSDSQITAESIIERVTRVAEQQHVRISRMEPDSSSTLRIWVNEVAFDSLMRALVELERGSDTFVGGTLIERASKTGAITGMVTVLSR